MVDLEVFRLRLARLQEVLLHLRELQQQGRSQVARDPGLRAQLERWLHLAVESSLDLGRQIIASRGWRLPATNREVFRVLLEQEVITGRLAEGLEGWAGLRNILVHLYLDLDFDLLFDALEKELDQIEEFAYRVVQELDSEEG